MAAVACVRHQQGHRVNRKRVQRLMRQMGLRAIYPKLRTSHPGHGHKIYPYRLRGLTIDRPNQAWASDICYSIPTAIRPSKLKLLRRNTLML